MFSFLIFQVLIYYWFIFCRGILFTMRILNCREKYKRFIKKTSSYTRRLNKDTSFISYFALKIYNLKSPRHIFEVTKVVLWQLIVLQAYAVSVRNELGTRDIEDTADESHAQVRLQLSLPEQSHYETSSNS